MLPQKRPGSLGYEALDASTYASWGVGFVKEDSCYGERPPEVDYGVMRDALNATGHPWPSACAIRALGMRRLATSGARGQTSESTHR